VPEFDALLPYFKKAWEEDCEERGVKAPKRQRKTGGGAVPRLHTDEERLLFILVHFKLYPLQAVLGFLFGLSQGRANEWIERLSGVLKKALGLAGVMPARTPEQAKAALSAAPTREFIIDGTERRINGPQNGKAEGRYSGKRKRTPSKTISSSSVRGVAWCI
jgi:hypothetical protein